MAIQYELCSVTVFLYLFIALFPHVAVSAPYEKSDQPREADVEKRIPVPNEHYSPSFYPTPNGGWAADWQDSYRRAAEIVANMTLAEKTNLTTGTGFMMSRCVGSTGSALRKGIPQLCLQDGPLGIRSTDNVTAFPAGITVGATWDKILMYQRGLALGEEFKAKGANIHLGPSVGPLGRKPRGGRNWEGFGSDPVLQAVGAAETVRGVQERGVIATVKHLIGNEQEMFRMYNLVQPGYSANIDDRTLHELYLWPFAESIRAGAGSIMAAYNDVNGSATTQNAYLLNGILKDELGFQGFVMTDWLSQISSVAAALAGLDVSMPGDGQVIAIPLLGQAWWASELSKSVLNGSVPISRVNDMVTRVVATWLQLGQDEDFPPPNFSSFTTDREGPFYPSALFSPRGVVNEYVNVQADHATIAREVAQDAITLLKNNDNTLPLSTTGSFKVFGDDAQENTDGPNACSDKGCNKGTLGMGWGSGTANYPYLDSPIEALRSRSANVQYYSSNSFPSNVVASPGDIALVFINADSGENYITVKGNPGDRTTANLYAWHGGDDLVIAAAQRFDTVIVVIHTVGPILLERWHDLESVKAIVVAHLPGQEAGQSLTNVLFGNVSPSGHLPYSIPVSEDNYPDSVDLVGFQLGQVQDTYSEGLYIDYRHLNKQNITPRYAFGHGLSYTTFSYTSATIITVTPLSQFSPAPPAKGSTPVYSNTRPPPSEAYYPANFPRVDRYLYSWLDKPAADAAYASTNSYPYPPGYTTQQKTTHPPAGGAPGGNPALWDTIYRISVLVTNTGSAPGKAVVQAYVHFLQGFAFETPVIQLRDFAKTATLQPEESATVEVRITRKDVSVWDVVRQNWRAAEAGGYTVWLGNSSDQLSVRCVASGCAAGVGRVNRE